MTYALGSKSLANLAGVHPLLVDVVNRAIAISDQDFGVTEPQVRTLDYQKTLVARGVSKTLKSNHIQRVDFTGKTSNLYGHAVDLVPWAQGRFLWDWNLIYEVMSAVSHAAADASQKVCWGGAWDVWMAPGDPLSMHKAEMDYRVRHVGKDFVDGPHVQIGVLG